MSDLGAAATGKQGSISIHHADISDVIAAFVGKARAMSTKQFAWIAFLIVILLGGTAIQLLAINFWIGAQWKNQNAISFVTFAVSNFFFAAFFIVALIIYLVTQKPKGLSKWAFSKKSIYYLFLIGFGDAFNSWLNIYAVPSNAQPNKTPEMLQALFNATQPIFTFILSKWILKDQRQFLNKWAGTAFFLMLGGVILAAAPDFADSTAMNRDSRLWSLIFFSSVIFQSWYNVLQSHYMEIFTEDPKKKRLRELRQEEGLPVEEAHHHHHHSDDERSPLIANNTDSNVENGDKKEDEDDDDSMKGEDGAVKAVMLAGDTIFQFVLCLIFLPADALPWFGESSSPAVAADGFIDGLACIFTCHMNGLYAFLYILGFLLMYVGSAYLNQYSPTLCSMIGQLSSPVTAVLLLIVPSWNLSNTNTAWYWSVSAVVMLTIGTIIYSIWEEMSELDNEEEDKKEEEEERKHLHEEHQMRDSERHFDASHDDNPNNNNNNNNKEGVSNSSELRSEPDNGARKNNNINRSAANYGSTDM